MGQLGGGKTFKKSQGSICEKTNRGGVIREKMGAKGVGRPCNRHKSSNVRGGGTSKSKTEITQKGGREDTGINGYKTREPREAPR